ncbi:MAG: MFS transporter [Mesorhizobium sp.]
MFPSSRLSVSAMFLANGFILGAWAPQIPLFKERLDISETTLGLMILGFGLGALFAMPVAGWLISRHGSRRVLSVSGIVCSISLVLVVAAPSVAVATCALVFFGAVFGGMDVTMNANGVTAERAGDRSIMSSLHGFWSLGGFAGGLSGGFIIERIGTTGHALVVCAIALMLVLVAMPFIVDEEKVERPAGTKARLPREPVLYLLGFIGLFSMIPEGSVLDWAALYLTQDHGATVATAGWGYAAFAGAMATMRFAGDPIRDRFGGVATLRVSAVISGLAMIAAALAPGEGFAIGAFAVAGLGIANMVPIVFSAAGNQKGIASGAAISVVTSIGYAGILLGPSGMGYVGDHFGFVPVFFAAGLMLVAVAFVAGLARAADGDQPLTER